MRCQALTATSDHERPRSVGHKPPDLPSPSSFSLPARPRESCLRSITNIQDADGIDGRTGNKPLRLLRERRARPLQVPRLPTVRSPNPRKHHHRGCPRHSSSRRTKGSGCYFRRPAPHHPQSRLHLEAESGHCHRT